MRVLKGKLKQLVTTIRAMQVEMMKLPMVMAAVAAVVVVVMINAHDVDVHDQPTNSKTNKTQLL